MLDFYKKNRVKNAFTMVEIMITLLIIGVVAVMTIPNLFQKINEQNTIKRVQKAYSVLSQAYLQSVEEYGVPSCWGIPLVTSTANAQKAMNNLFFRLKITKKCVGLDSKNCGISQKYLRMRKKYGYSDFNAESSVSGVLSDGLSVQVFVNDSSKSRRGSTPALTYTLGFVNIDINGYNPPNRLGYDYFLFYISDYGIIPIGSAQEINDNNLIKQQYITCSDDKSYGRGCSSWILKEKNMKYLHSNKCSWRNTSCN